MTDLKKAVQTDSGALSGRPRDEQPEDDRKQGGQRKTSGSNRDADPSDVSKNPGHGHAREDRGAHMD